jgi:hypothetical protein
MDLYQAEDLFTSLEEKPVELIDETARWRARNVEFIAGQWESLSRRIPRFVIEDFKATSEGPANPHLRSVVRLPLSITEQRIPVGVVSNTYRLAQHKEVVEKCFEGLRAHQIDARMLKCEVGLTPLGEWMNFRAYFPENYCFSPSDGNKLALRLECFNSVDGSSRLVILLGWFRFICANGLIIGETKAELRDVHDGDLNLQAIPGIISEGLTKVKTDLARLKRWGNLTIQLDSAKFIKWINGHLTEKWGKKAACRTLHICRSGRDAEFTDPFAQGKPSEKQVNLLDDVPGAPTPAENLYDVCQALSWIASRRNNADERLAWQGQIAELVDNLRVSTRK